MTKVHLEKIITTVIILVLGSSVFYFWQLNKRLENSSAQSLATSRISFFDFSQNVRTALENGFVLLDEQGVTKVNSSESEQWYTEFKRSFGRTQLKPDKNKISEYLKNNIADKKEKKATNAKFSFLDGEIYEIAPGKDGREVDIELTVNDISEAVFSGNNIANIVFKKVEPTITKHKLDLLGIKTMLGKGESDFKGSSAARIHNIKTAVAIYDGLLIEPGQEFSFNEILGEVDAGTGYKAELVIKGDKLIPEYGGGVCQVSTTMFRSAINAGLPIIERKSHSLSVRYYTPQGFDATIYPGVVDLKF